VIRFIVRRLIATIVVMVAISIITFLLFAAIPNGNPAFRIAGRNATAAEIQQIDVEYGFNKPIYVQYAKTMKNIFTGKAYSYTQGFNVDTELRHDLPVTLYLAIGSGLLWLFTSIVIGTIAALKAGKYADRLINVMAMIGVSFPPFFLGSLFLYYLGYKANIFPLGGYVSPTKNVGEWALHLVLPWITLAILYVGFYCRVLRSTILDTINEDYVRTAHAKGLSDRQVLIRHTLRNSMIPIISLWGLDMAAVIGGGTILIESVFNLPGVGLMAYQSIQRLDLVPLLVIVLLAAFAVVVMATLVDILYAYLDPRIRL
jgi:peptide/nickel transport system permease protein